MRRIMLLVPVLISLIIFTATPAIAHPANMTPVKATITPIASGSVLGTYFVTDGGILQLRGAVATGTVKLFISSMITPDFTLTDRHEFFGTVNMGQEIPNPGPWPDAKGEWHSTLVWSYVVNNEVLGTFEGQWAVTSTGWYLTPVFHYGPTQGHAVLQGSGIFDGMTLILDSTGPPSVFTGNLVTH